MAKKIDIPQEENKVLGGQRKVMYAPDESGEFNTFKYSSSVEEYATSLAVEEYKELMEQATKEIEDGISSPILFLMYKNRMDLPTLASILDMFQFRVKRHLQAKHYKKLNDKILSKYAFAFDMELEELKGFTLDK